MVPWVGTRVLGTRVQGSPVLRSLVSALSLHRVRVVAPPCRVVCGALCRVVRGPWSVLIVICGCVDALCLTPQSGGILL